MPTVVATFDDGLTRRNRSAQRAVMKSMGKTLSSKAKTPPVPMKSHAEIDEWLRGRMPGLQPIVKQVDEVTRRTLPGVHYALKWKRAYYGSTKTGWMIELAPYDVSVNANRDELSGVWRSGVAREETIARARYFKPGTRPGLEVAGARDRLLASDAAAPYTAQLVAVCCRSLRCTASRTSSRYTFT